MSERPNQSISYKDLQTIGWNIEFTKKGEDNEGDPVYRVVKVSLNGRKMDEKALEKQLDTLGIDLRYFHYSVDDKAHKPLTTGVEWKGYRFVGPERVDKYWLDSGCASEEAQVCGSNFLDLDKHLRMMRNGGERR